ncbi:MAG: hypothetical protein UMR38_05285 [Candidatus Izemoplasma sp.]|nr:hypothetical protein [Candidatus Izemoplasma sp.]
MKKFKILMYLIIAIALQVLLGYVTGKGQGGIGMLIFIVLIELDPSYSFTYLLQNNDDEKT